MGGGGAMRAAFKAAGVGLHNAGIRGLPENFSIRRAIRPQASVLSSSATTVEDSSKLEIAASSGQAAPVAASELDDWDFAGYDADDNPRLVFGPAPSLDETKEATSQLSDALDMMYFSPAKCAGSTRSVSEIDEQSVVSESEVSQEDAKNWVDQNPMASSVPNQAMQAFSLLRENAATQSVVASIAADPKVWNAVLQNDALNKYLQAEKKSHAAAMEGQEQEEEFSKDGSASYAEAVNFFNEFAENVKVAVAGWVHNMSSFFHELFDATEARAPSGPSSWSPGSSSVCGTLFALASMVIMVVVLKRG